jgi:hypothetical protein
MNNPTGPPPGAKPISTIMLDGRRQLHASMIPMKARPVVAITKKPARGYHVDGRVSIALDALNDTQKRAVGEVVVDLDHFLAHTADSGKVETISKTRSVYALSVPVGLNIIYKKTGESIEVLDLMGEETLRRYGAKKAARNKSPKRAGKRNGSI